MNGSLVLVFSWVGEWSVLVRVDFYFNGRFGFHLEYCMEILSLPSQTCCVMIMESLLYGLSTA